MLGNTFVSKKLNLIYQVLLGQNAGLVVVVLHHVEEVWVLGLWDVSQPFGNRPLVRVQRSAGVQAADTDSP